jgi:hypothetical protein
LSAIGKLQKAKRSVWDLVTGPATALVASLWRVGWSFLSPTKLLDDRGTLVDIELDSPAAITTIMKRSVRRWQLCRVALSSPPLIPLIPDMDQEAAVLQDARLPHPLDPPRLPAYRPDRVRIPKSVVDLTTVLGKHLHHRRPQTKDYPDAHPQHRPYLMSTVTGGQWPQQRVAMAARASTGYVEDVCQLCKEATGTLLHRQCCPVTLPEGGWPQPSREATTLRDKLDEPRRHLLMTRGLLTMRMAIPDRPIYGWFKWILPLPDTDVQGLLWYVDGSLLDGTDVQISRCGFAVVVLTAEFDLLAYGFGAPPAWVTTAAAAEAWAYLTTLRLSPAPRSRSPTVRACAPPWPWAEQRPRRPTGH